MLSLKMKSFLQEILIRKSSWIEHFLYIKLTNKYLNMRKMTAVFFPHRLFQDWRVICLVLLKLFDILHISLFSWNKTMTLFKFLCDVEFKLLTFKLFLLSIQMHRNILLIFNSSLFRFVTNDFIFNWKIIASLRIRNNPS